MNIVPQQKTRSSNATWRLAALALAAAVLGAGCLGAAPTKPLDAPIAAAHEDGVDHQQTGAAEPSTATVPAPASPAPPQPNAPATPSQPVEPPAVPLPPQESLSIRNLDYRSQNTSGPVAIELVLLVEPSTECTATTSFLVSDQLGVTSRHILWKGQNRAWGVVGDVSLENASLPYAFTQETGGVRPATNPEPGVRRDNHTFAFNVSAEAPPQAWTYLVAAGDVRTEEPDSLSMQIDCSQVFSVIGVRAGDELALLNQQTIESFGAVSTSNSTAVVQGAFRTVLDHDVVLSLATNRSDASFTISSPEGRRTWTASPAGEDGVDHFDLEAGPGPYSVEVDSRTGSFSILLASLVPIPTIDYLPHALNA